MIRSNQTGRPTISACCKFLVILALAGSFGISQAHANDRVSLLLDWTWWPPQIPLLVAVEKGYFEDEGIDIDYRQGSGSSTTAQTVGQGTYDMGHVNLTTAAQNIASGVPIRAVATISPLGASALVYKKGAITDVDDLLGKRIGSTAGGSDAQILPAFFEKNQIDEDDVRVVNLPGDAKLGALLADQIDVVSGDGYYYIALAAERGYELEQMVFGDFDANTLGYGLIANEEFIANHPDRIERFVAAAMRGYQYTEENMDEAIEIYKRISRTDQSEDTVELILSGFLDLIKSGADDGADPYSGVNRASDWTSTIDVLSNYGGLESDKDPSEYWTNEFVRGAQ